MGNEGRIDNYPDKLHKMILQQTTFDNVGKGEIESAKPSFTMVFPLFINFQILQPINLSPQIFSKQINHYA